MRRRILVVDDEVTLNQFVATNLMLEGYEVQAAYSAQEAYRKLSEFSPHLVILDVMMPNVSGFDVLAHIRTFSKIPVIMVTARIKVQDRVHGLSLGADDYLVKPFALEELLARVSALLRRAYSDEKDSALDIEEILEVEGLMCNVTEHRASICGDELVLQNLEFKLLCAFLRSPDRILTYDYLMTVLWNDAEGSLATLRVTIGKLRSKIKEKNGQDWIENVHGVGYRLMRPSAVSQD